MNKIIVFFGWRTESLIRIFKGIQNKSELFFPTDISTNLPRFRALIIFLKTSFKTSVTFFTVAKLLKKYALSARNIISRVID